MSAIWIDNQGSEQFLRARKIFDVQTISMGYRLRLTCSGRYCLWINETLVARGPAHSGSNVKRVDELDVTEWLQPGVNLIAVQLIHFDYFTATGVCERPAFECSLHGTGVQLQSDTGWKMSVDDAYRFPSFRRNNMYGPQEIYDARLEEAWKAVGYDDSEWLRAVEVERSWGKEVPRGIPFSSGPVLSPVSVFRIAEVVDQEHFPEMWHYESYQSLAVSLLQDVPEKPKLSIVEGADTLVNGDVGCMTVTQPFANDPEQDERRCATVIFDFGREITGYTQFELEGNAGAIMDVVHGELITAGRVQAMRQGTHYADRYILREGRQRHEIYDWKGFRYIQLTFRNLTRPLSVHDLSVSFSSYPVSEEGRFECEDKLLEQIWQTGAYTQQLCMHDRLMDCPWREQVQWLGDGRIQLVIIQNAFGANDICRKFVEDFAHSQYENGFIPSLSGAGQSSPVRDIVDYALWWVVAACDVITFDRDERFAVAMLPHMERLLEYFRSYVNDDGLIDNIPGWVFIDWANLCRKGCVAPLNGIYYMALQSAVTLAQLAGADDLAESYRKSMLLIEKNYHRIFWSKDHGFYRDCVTDAGPSDHAFSQHTQVISVLSGLSRVDAGELMARTLSDRQLVQTAPYFSFYLLEALAQAGMRTQAVQYIREQWGAMTRAGATTFWEEWQVDGTYRDGVWAARPRSLCHAWSAAPTAWLSRHLLGIRPASEKKKVLFAPNVCDLSMASGAVPTLYGPVNVSWTVSDGMFCAELILPEDDLVVDFRPPQGFENSSELIIQNQRKVGQAEPEPVCL